MPIKIPEHKILAEGKVETVKAEFSDTVTYDSLGDFIQSAVLGFCNCGMPDDSLSFILGGLRLLNEKCGDSDDRKNWNNWYSAHRERCTEHFKTGEAEYFFYYWADKEGLTEHGGSVPGWLDSSGEKLLELLELWDKEEDDEE